MQVICSQCGAKYEFDAAAIPAAGYDAQCTTCGHVFFVAPEKAAAPEALVTISCTGCGATYQFAASAIPPGGYDAQCTQCQAVFFVAGPVAPAAPVGVTTGVGAAPVTAAVAATPAMSTIPVLPTTPVMPTTPMMAATPTMPVMPAMPMTSSTSVMPAAGAVEPLESLEPLMEAQPEELVEEPVLLDASDARAAAPAAPSDLPSFAAGSAYTPQSGFAPLPSALPEAAPLMPTDAAAAALPDFAGSAPAREVIDLDPAMPLAPAGALGVEPGMAAPSPAADGAVLPASSALELDAPSGASAMTSAAAALSTAAGDEKSAADLVALGASLGDAAETASEPAIDFAAIMKKRRLRLRLGLGAVAAVAAAVAVMYFFVPRAFDLSIGRVIGVKLTVNPDAIPFVTQAKKSLLDDSAAGYADALGQLDKAMALDDQYPEAMALAAIVHTLRGMDSQAAGKEIFDRGAKALAAHKALEAQQPPPADAKARLEALRSEIAEANAASTRLFEEGGKDLSAAQLLLRVAMKIGAGNAVVAEAAGVYFAADSDAVSRAEDQLKKSVRLLAGEGQTLDLVKPPDALAPYLQGRIWILSKLDRDRAQQAFAAALVAEPRFQRARFELAAELLRVGKTAEARKVLEEILAAVPAHEKAKALLPRLSDSSPASPVVAADAEADRGKGAADAAKGKRKAKGKRRN